MLQVNVYSEKNVLCLRDFIGLSVEDYYCLCESWSEKILSLKYCKILFIYFPHWRLLTVKSSLVNELL